MCILYKYILANNELTEDLLTLLRVLVIFWSHMITSDPRVYKTCVCLWNPNCTYVNIYFSVTLISGKQSVSVFLVRNYIFISEFIILAFYVFKQNNNWYMQLLIWTLSLNELELRMSEHYTPEG